MSNFCGPKSGCKTNRCVCKLKNSKCKINCSRCQCNPEYCDNVNDYSDEDDEPKRSITKSQITFKNDSSDSESDNNKMSCSCSKDKCRSKRCKCLKNGLSCSGNCECNDCENRAMRSSLVTEEVNTTNCKCQSGCATNHCVCKKNKNFCEDYCSCKNCENQRYRMDIDEGINEIASKLSEVLRVQVANKRDDVFQFRKNIDIYTSKSKNEIENPQVDHIIEDQMVAHAAARVFRYINGSDPYIDGLRKALNVSTLENYNVTFGRINGSKGAIIKEYLKDGMNQGYPLRAMIKPESHFGKNIEPIFKAMNDTHSIVEEYISEAKRSDNNIRGSKFGEISDELNKIVQEMQLDINGGRRLRKNY